MMMPIHDWSRVDANLFHDFHQTWTIAIRNALNGGLLPKGYSALAEQHAPALVPDVLALPGRKVENDAEPVGGAVVAAVLPKVRYTIKAQQSSMAARANRITIRHSLGRVVCVIEIMSPGNKHSVSALRSFVEKSHELLENGVNLLIVDMFPPTARDPQGIHPAIWDEVDGSPFEFDKKQPLTLVAYVAGLQKIALVEPVAVGEVMPDMPAYLDEDHYVPVPLEATYMQSWKSCPEDMREVVEKGELPKP
jgi:hypothetical protein